MEQYVIEMEHITKEFGSFKANDDITLRLKKVRYTRCWERTAQESPL